MTTNCSVTPSDVIITEPVPPSCGGEWRRGDEQCDSRQPLAVARGGEDHDETERQRGCGAAACGQDERRGRGTSAAAARQRIPRLESTLTSPSASSSAIAARIPSAFA